MSERFPIRRPTSDKKELAIGKRCGVDIGYCPGRRDSLTPTADRWTADN